jgi:quercetin dioxygenase-like cupin family protein
MRRPTLVASGLAATSLTTTVVAAAALGAAPATATPPVGPPVTSPSPVVEHHLQRKVRAHSDGVGLKLPKGAVVRDFTLTYQPGDSSGWHEHPGVVLATVVSGSVERRLPCKRGEPFRVGDAFVEVGPHLVQNLGAEAAVLSITQIAPKDTTGTGFREDRPEPVCKPHHH